MATILLVIHLMIAVTLVATILLQRSEGGALGIGGGGGGLVSNRAAGNALTRSSGILAAMFFMTSIGLTLLAREDSRNQSILDAEPAAVTAPAVPGDADATPVPVAEEPASDELLVPRAE
ncbi:MAG: preprotein translocase subunit SecG [Rhodobiaceae bacterium]|nr:MAG: preprotein translocase subunit SecG [Rhodobiaceae bacterium]